MRIIRYGAAQIQNRNPPSTNAWRETSAGCSSSPTPRLRHSTTWLGIHSCRTADQARHGRRGRSQWHARLGAWLAQLPRDANVPFDGYRGQTWRAVPQVLQPPLRFAVDDSYGWYLADSKAPVGECFVSNASGGDGTAHEPVLNAAVGDLAARPSAQPEAAMPHMYHVLARGAAKSSIRHAAARAPWQPGLVKQRPHGSGYPGR